MKDALHVLLVDDDKLVLDALQEILKREGYCVMTAQDGATAIELLKKQPIAAILCDQGMPGMNGIDVLKQAQSIQPDALRLVITGNSDLDTVLKAINIGQISQFILKPWDDAQLKQTLATALEKYRLAKENHDLHEQLRHDLKLGARIHETLLLGKIPRDVPGFAIEATTVPSREIDGDFFEFYQPHPDILDVVIGDVMGKGIPAALVGTAVKTQLLRFAIPFTRTQMYDKHRFWEEDLLKPNEILSHVHREITPHLIHLDYFVSLFYGRFDLKRHTFTFVDCGFTKPIHYRKSQNKATPLVGHNFPLGIVEKNKYDCLEVPYGEGDCFIFYSDGVTETKSTHQGLYGFERIIRIAEEYASEDPSALVQRIKKEVMSFAEKDHLDDDLTLLIIKIVEFKIQKAALITHARFSADLSQLQAVREHIHRLCQQAPGDPLSLSLQLQLAINEAFCNIVKHGYQGQSHGIVAIQAECRDEGIAIEISDRGRTFDPTRIEEPSLAGDKDTGFGWHLIREIADRVEYIHKASEEGWNHLRLYKKFYLEGKSMQFSHVTDHSILVITPQGTSLDAKYTPEFKEKVIQLITKNNHVHVVFDLHELQFIDSSGLGTMLTVMRTLRTSGGELKLACLNKPIRMMLELVSMHKIFEIYNSTEEAVRSFR